MNEKHKRSMIIHFNDGSKKLLGVDILVNNAGIQHEQIGAAALFLCAPAAAQIRGIALPVDGGWTAQ
jgi:NAD(P)-dependent dehydrogenase (short-subunit alcohol dehydrogenase family)